MKVLAMTRWRAPWLRWPALSDAIRAGELIEIKVNDDG